MYKNSSLGNQKISCYSEVAVNEKLLLVDIPLYTFSYFCTKAYVVGTH